MHNHLSHLITIYIEWTKRLSHRIFELLPSRASTHRKIWRN